MNHLQETDHTTQQNIPKPQKNRTFKFKHLKQTEQKIFNEYMETSNIDHTTESMDVSMNDESFYTNNNANQYYICNADVVNDEVEMKQNQNKLKTFIKLINDSQEVS